MDYDARQTTVEKTRATIESAAVESGRVVAADALNGLAKIDLGSDKGIRPPVTLDVVRDGVVVAWLLIDTVFAETALGVVVADVRGFEVRTGDVVEWCATGSVRPLDPALKRRPDCVMPLPPGQVKLTLALQDVVVPPAMSGRVTNVDHAMRLVQLDLGTNQGMRRGYCIDVVRERMFIARVRVDTVSGEASVGLMIVPHDGAEVRVGDEVTTRLQ
ncbi:MAG: hypothetical protein CMJ83_11030 [Planctomycetes bacterium]|nr:hypothetical protein [Planctomycetota bacterium]